MPWPKKKVIFDANFRSKKWILHLLSCKCLWCLPTNSFGLVFRCGNMRVMEVLWATASDIKSLESRFLWNFVMWMEGMGRCLLLWMWSLVLGTLASTQWCNSSQIYNQYFTSAGEKNDHNRGTKSSNRTLCFFLGTPIHVGIILTKLIWDQYHSKKLVLVSLSKNTFSYICIELSR